MTMNTRTSSSVALPSSLMKEETETEEEEEAEHHIRQLQQQQQQQRRQRHKDNPGDLDIILVVKKDKKNTSNLFNNWTFCPDFHEQKTHAFSKKSSSPMPR